MPRNKSKFSIRMIGAALLFSCCAAVPPAIAQPSAANDFLSFVNGRFAGSSGSGGKAAAGLDCAIASDPLAARVLSEYGSMFAATEAVVLPGKCIYSNSQEVAAFQRTLATSVTELSGSRVELQTAAVSALDAARAEAIEAGVAVSPFDPPVAARRDYNDSVRIWNKRLFPALDFWGSSGVITPEESFALRNMPFVQQARKVLEWENRGYNFGPGRAKSIFASCSPPGASQHLSLLALDVLQYQDARVRLLLNRHGWYQTVVDDPGHFTFLGIAEAELPARGLKLVPAGAYSYWVPDIRKPVEIPVAAKPTLD